MDGPPPEPPTGEGHGEFRHPETLDNRSPAAVNAVYAGVIQFLQQYGWFVLFAVILLFIAKQRLTQYLSTRPSSRSAEQDLHRYDSETVLKRQECFEASRRRLQEKMDAESARFAEEQKKKDEEKRKQKIADWDNHLEGKGYRSKYKPQDAPDDSGCSASGSSSGTSQQQKKNKSTYRPSDYNPLTGGGGGANFRPPARRGGGG